ncbi:hypothetical protein [Gangjinia marincola]
MKTYKNHVYLIVFLSILLVGISLVVLYINRFLSTSSEQLLLSL